jgi:hypothetical protein
MNVCHENHTIKLIEKHDEMLNKTHCQIADNVKIKNCITVIVTIVFLSISGTGYCDSGLTYYDTVNLIKKLLPDISSDARKESYGYITFSDCTLDYNVSGTFPTGALYNIKYSNIDFSSLNYQVSKVGFDNSHFIILNFNNSFNYRMASDELTVRTVVIDAASNEQAQTLFTAFLHLGELCGAGKSTL